MFIQTEATPNPATLKFLPGQPVMEEGTFEARDLDQAERSPLAKALMQLPGVGGVFFAYDFISVTKSEGEWQHLRPAVLGVVTEFYLSGAPLIEEGGADAVGSGEFFDPKDAETVEAIKELIETRVRPAVAGDGGDIIFKGFRDGVVYLKMKGACSGCPSSTATLRHGNREPSQALPAGRSGDGAVRGLTPRRPRRRRMFLPLALPYAFGSCFSRSGSRWRAAGRRSPCARAPYSRLSHYLPLAIAVYLLGGAPCSHRSPATTALLP